MARHPTRKREILRDAAALYQQGSVNTATSQYKLTRAIVIEHGPSASIEATERVIMRSYKLTSTSPDTRRERLWQDVLSCSSLPKGAAERVDLSDNARRRLGLELLAGDPTFALVNEALEAARLAGTAETRLGQLRLAADALVSATAGAARSSSGNDVRLEQGAAAWAAVFDAALAADLGTDATGLGAEATGLPCRRSRKVTAACPPKRSRRQLPSSGHQAASQG